MPEKAMQKVWKIMPKWRPNGCQDRLKIWKYAKKGMAKINAEIWCWKICKRRFWDHFLDRFLERFGGKGGGLNSSKDFRLTSPQFNTPCTPGRGAADENLCPNGPQKSSQNRHLGDQGSDFWGFWQCFEECDFWWVLGCAKSRPKMRKVRHLGGQRMLWVISVACGNIPAPGLGKFRALQFVVASQVRLHKDFDFDVKFYEHPTLLAKLCAR